MVLVCFFVVFFFMHKTAYELRISDWSSDVFSSDLVRHDGETVTLATSIGLPVENGYFVFSGQFSDRDPTNRSGADPRRQFTTVGDPRELTFDRYNHRFGDGKSTDYNFFVKNGRAHV